MPALPSPAKPCAAKWRSWLLLPWWWLQRASRGPGRVREADHRMPGNRNALEDFDRVIEHDADHHECCEHREQERRVEVRVRTHEQVAEAGAGADPLRDDGADDRERDRHLESREDVWQRERN